MPVELTRCYAVEWLDAGELDQGPDFRLVVTAWSRWSMARRDWARENHIDTKELHDMTESVHPRWKRKD